LDAIVARGYQLGGHRGDFDPKSRDKRLSTIASTALLVQQTRSPVIAAGGIMDEAGISAVLKLAAVAGQLGTAFLGCFESAASEEYRQSLLTSKGTEMVSIISGRPARTLLNRGTETTLRLETQGILPPDHPTAYDAGKRLHAAAMERGRTRFRCPMDWSGCGMARSLPAQELMQVLAGELLSALP